MKLLIRQQNRLLEQQNKLLAKLTQHKKTPRSDSAALAMPELLDGEQIFVDNLFRDEIRDGFFIPSRLKRLWNVQINMLVELDRICKKHGIRYFAIGGTLLGAARHKGFIPWDDDLDVIMFRPDYEKFKIAAEEELKNHPHYKMWYWYNHRLETDPQDVDPSIMELPFVSKEQRDEHPLWAPFFPLLRILDKRTTYFQDERTNIHYATWLDIFCLDPCPPFDDEKTLRTFQVGRRILGAISIPERMMEDLNSGITLAISRDKLLEILEYPFRKKALLLEEFLAETFTQTPYVCEFPYCTIKNFDYTYKTKCFENVIYLPFEKIKIPCPAEYDEVLTDRYGDWHELPTKKQKHAEDFTVEIPYEEFFKQIR